MEKIEIINLIKDLFKDEEEEEEENFVLFIVNKHRKRI